MSNFIDEITKLCLKHHRMDLLSHIVQLYEDMESSEGEEELIDENIDVSVNDGFYELN